MKLHQIKLFFAKTISQFCMVVFLVLFAAAAEGSLPLIAALVLGLVNLVVLNALCGVLLGKPAEQEAAEPETTPVVYTVPRRSTPVTLRLAHSNKVA